MSTGAPAHLFQLALALVLASLGVAHLVVGFRGRRRGSAPFCGRCGYSLQGIDSSRCPECGVTLDETTVRTGRRERQPPLMVFGALLALVSLGWFVISATGALRNINWYQYRPTAWVLDDLESSNPMESARAWAELQRREQRHPLSPAQRDRLVSGALKQQVAPLITSQGEQMVDWLANAALAGQLNEAQKTKFFQQIISMTLRVRPDAALGDRVPYSVDFQSRGPGNPWWVRLESVSTELDGRPLPAVGGGSMSSGMGGGGGLGSSFPCEQAGQHTLTIVQRVEVFRGPLFRTIDRVYSQDVKLSQSFKVSPASSARRVKLVRDPSLAQSIRGAITIRSVEIMGNQLKLELEIAAVPVNVAFDAFVRTRGVEQKLGSVSRAKGLLPLGTQVQGTGPPGDYRSVSVILRSSESAARSTIDLYEIWEGELEFDNVPVNRRP